MNKIFKTVFNENTNSWVAVPEISKNHKVSTSCNISTSKFSPKLKILSILVANALCVGTVYAQNACSFDTTTNRFICGSNNHKNGSSDAGGTDVYVLGDDNNKKIAAEGSSEIIAIGKGNNKFASTESDVGSKSIAIGFDNAAIAELTSSSVAVGFGNMATESQVYAFGANNNNLKGLKDSNNNPITYVSSAYRNSYPIGSKVLTIGDSNNYLYKDEVDSIRKRYRTSNADWKWGHDIVAVGFNNLASATNSVAIGNQNNYDAVYDDVTQSTSRIGNGENSVAVGNFNNALGDNSIALGNKSDSTASYSIAIGNNATAGLYDYKNGQTTSGNYSIAIGYDALAQHEDSIAIGTFSQTRDTSSETAAYKPTSVQQGDEYKWSPTKGVVSFGGGDNNNTRRIMGVAAGSAATDAVNVAQLKAALSSSGNYTPITFKTGTGDNTQSFQANSGKTINFQTAEGSSITVALSSDNNGNGTITLGGGGGSLDNAKLQSAIEDYFSTNNIDIQGAIDSATAAETSANAAKSSAESAQTYASNAEKSANAAKSSADAAKSSAEDISNKLNNPMLTVIGDKVSGSNDATSFTRTFGETITFQGANGITATAEGGVVTITGTPESFKSFTVSGDAVDKQNTTDPANPVKKSFTVDSSTNLAINGSSFITTTADAGTVSINVDDDAFSAAVKAVDGFGGDGIKGIDVKVGGNTVAASQDGKTPASTGLTALNFTNTGNVKATWSGEGDNVGITLNAEGDGVGLESFTVKDNASATSSTTGTKDGEFTVGGTNGKSGLTFTGTGGITTTANDGTVSIGLSDNFAQNAVSAYAQTQDFKDLVKNAAGDNFKSFTVSNGTNTDKFTVETGNTASFLGGNNINATVNKDKQSISFGLSSNLTGLDSITFAPADPNATDPKLLTISSNGKISNLANGTLAGDAVNKAQLDAIEAKIPTNALTSINNISVGEATTNLVQNGLTIVGSGDASVDLADNTLTIGFNESFKSFTVSGDAEDKTDPANPVKQSFTVDSSTNLAINGSSFIKTTADNGTVSIDVDKDGFDKAVKDAVGDIPDQIKYNGDTNITVDDAKKTISLNDDITVTSLTASSATIGAATFNANGVNMGGKAITNIANATTDTDAVAWGQVKDNLFNGVQMQIDGNDASSLSKNVNLITGDNVQLVWDDDKKGIKISATAVPTQADITTALDTYAKNTFGDSFENALSDINDNLSDINDKINNTTSIPTVTTVSGRKKTANNTNSNMRLLRAPTLKAPTNSDPEIKIYSWAGVDVMRDNDGDYLVHLDFSGIDSETGNTQVVESKLDLALKNELETDGSTLQQAFNTQTASAIKNNDAVKQAINTAVNNAITQDGSSVKATLEQNFATKDALDATNNALDKLTQKVSTIEGLDGDVSNLIDKVDNNYTDLDGKISAVDTKTNTLDTELKNLDSYVKVLGERADGFDNSIKGINSNIEDISAEITKLSQNGTVFKGFDVAGDSGETFKVENDGTININGDGKNISTVASKGNSGAITIKLSDDISVNSLQANSISVGSTQINTNGISVGSTQINNSGINVGSTSISDGAVVVGNGVSLTSEGLNNGYNRIQGVAAGVAPTDAVNVEQLQSLANSVSEYVSNTETRLSQRMDKIEKNSNAAAAAAMASAGLQTAALPGGNSMSISAVTFGGQQGYAIGYMKMSQSGKWGFRAFGNANSRGKYGVGASVGFHWQ